MDFQFDAIADGRRLKFLNVIDEHSEAQILTDHWRRDYNTPRPHSALRRAYAGHVTEPQQSCNYSRCPLHENST